MRHRSFTLAAALLCSACNVTVTDANDSAPQDGQAGQDERAGQPGAPAGVTANADPFAFQVVAEAQGRPFQPDSILQAQVALDRAGFSPGVIDGKSGMTFTAAITGFQVARGLPPTGDYDQATADALLKGAPGSPPQPTTWLVRIPPGFAQGPFNDIPQGLNAQAKLPALGYRNLVEKLAERFHTTPEMLVSLNPGSGAGPDGIIRVPAIANQPVATIAGDESGWALTLAGLAVAADQPRADHLVVDKSEGVLKAYDAENKLIAQFPATMGSQHDPLPIGTWDIKGVSRNPVFHYNPDLFWDASSKDEKAVLKPGPNGPVGVVWIDLSKDHYGIHGTPAPQTIGRSESHGCIRLTNWDAARLAQMVRTGVKAVFQE